MAVSTKTRGKRPKKDSAKPRFKMKVRAGDDVIVIAGKDKGRRGKVLRVVPETQRVVVEGLNIVKRHTKPRPPANAQEAARQQPTGGVIQREAPLHVSNVQLVSPASDKPTRVGYRFDDQGRKVRVARRDGVDLEK
jgi:large subunit ribosomal protein L24